MYRSNGTSTMATLLQQSNCMKSLSTNGGGAGTGPDTNNSTTISTGSSDSTGKTGTAGVAPATQQRALLPHEMVGMTQSPGLLPHQQNHYQYNNNFGFFGNHHLGHNSHNSITNSNSHPHTTTTSSTTAAATTTTTSLTHNNSHHLPHHNNHQTTSGGGVNHHRTGAASGGASGTTTTLLPHQQPSHYLPHQLPLHGRLAVADSNAAAAAANQTGGGQQQQQQSTHHNSSHLQTQQQHSTDRLSPAASNCSGEHIGGDATDGGGTADGDAAAAAAAAAEEQEPEPEIDIVINNVVCSFSVRCHLNLREIARNGVNVEFRRENGMVTMKLRRPYTTASIWSSGRITCTGATSEDQAKVAARRYARCLQKLGFNVRFRHFRVVNVLGTCSMPWAIKIVNFSEKYKKDASYEPELHPGVTYKLKWPKATLKIFSTGSITVTANSVENVQKAIEHIFPLVYDFRKKRAPDDPKLLKQQAAAAAAAAAKAAEAEAASTSAAATEDSTIDTISSGGGKPKRKHPFGHASNDPADDIMYVSDTDELMEGDDDDDLIEEDDDDDDDGDDDIDGVK